MSLLDIEKYKIRKPVKKVLGGQDVYILPNLNAAAGMAKSFELKDLDENSDVFSFEYAAVFVKHHVVNKKGERLFDQAISEIVAGYDAEFIDALYGFVLDVAGDPLGELEDIKKKS